jgi:hypothetical protein
VVNYFPNEGRKVPLGRPTRYPWKEWIEGPERVLKEGADFSCMAESFVLLARRTARVRGLEVVISTVTVSKTAVPLPIQVNGEDVVLEPGGTYVILKFSEPKEG